MSLLSWKPCSGFPVSLRVRASAFLITCKFSVLCSFPFPFDLISCYILTCFSSPASLAFLLIPWTTILLPDCLCCFFDYHCGHPPSHHTCSGASLHYLKVATALQPPFTFRLAPLVFWLCFIVFRIILTSLITVFLGYCQSLYNRM